VTQTLAIFSESYFTEKCGSLFPQKHNFVIVLYTVVNIQLKIGIYRQIGVLLVLQSLKTVIGQKYFRLIFSQEYRFTFEFQIEPASCFCRYSQAAIPHGFNQVLAGLKDR